MGWALKRWWPVCRTALRLCDVCRCPCCCCWCCFVVCPCLLVRVTAVLCHPRGVVLGHACGIPPTGANVTVIVLKTEITAGSSYTYETCVLAPSIPGGGAWLLLGLHNRHVGHIAFGVHGQILNSPGQLTQRVNARAMFMKPPPEQPFLVGDRESESSSDIGRQNQRLCHEI